MSRRTGAYDGVVGYRLALWYLVNMVVVCPRDGERRGREQEPEAPRRVISRHRGGSGIPTRSQSRSRRKKVGHGRSRFAALVRGAPGTAESPKVAFRKGRRRDYRMQVGKLSRSSKCLHTAPCSRASKVVIGGTVREVGKGRRHECRFSTTCQQVWFAFFC